jgi:hypothetical protein
MASLGLLLLGEIVVHRRFGCSLGLGLSYRGMLCAIGAARHRPAVAYLPSAIALDHPEAAVRREEW